MEEMQGYQWVFELEKSLADGKEAKAMDLMYRTNVTDLYDENKLHLLAGSITMINFDLVVDHLIKAGNDINAKDNRGRSTLEKALDQQNFKLASKLIDAGAILDINYFTSKRGPLHLAALDSHPGLVKQLLDKGLDVNAVDRVGNTPLHCTSMNNYASSDPDKTKVIQALLDAGADVNAKNSGGFTPLHYMRESQVEMLLDKGADANAVTRWGRTPLCQIFYHYCGQTRVSVDVIDKLLDAGCEINRLDVYGRSALHYAMRYFDEDSTRFLLKRGAIVDLLDRQQLDPLSFTLKVSTTHALCYEVDSQPVVHEKVIKCIKILLKHGAKVNRSDNSTSPLYAILSNISLIEIVHYFLTQGAIFNIDDEIIRKILEKKPGSKLQRLLLQYATVSNIRDKRDEELWVNTDFDFKINKLGDVTYTYYTECRNELSLMKRMRIDNTEVTYFNILAKKNIARYVNNEDVIAAFNEKKNITELFPIYGDDLYECYSINKNEQSLIREALGGLSHILELDQYAYAIIFDHILYYLSEEDILELVSI